MRLEFKKITLRNFLSFGNVPQTIDLNRDHLRVITGVNKDKSENPDDKNGIGKSSIFEAIHYVIYGDSINNKIRLGSLINNINKKNMYVTLVFSKDDVEYEITRGRLPNILTLKRNGENVISDESQGDSRDTQQEIENIIGINEMTFDQIACLTRKVPMYYNQSLTNQKAILEKILGIDIISKKIEALKELIKNTKNDINNEEFKINTYKTQNANLLESIEKQTQSMIVAKNTRIENINQQILRCEEIINSLGKIDFDKEMENFKLLENYLMQQGVNQQNQQLKVTLEANIGKIEGELIQYEDLVKRLSIINFDEETSKHTLNENTRQEQEKYNIDKLKWEQQKQHLEKNLLPTFQRLSKEVEAKKEEIANIKGDVCPTCGGKITSTKFATYMKQKKYELSKLEESYHQCDLEILESNQIISEFKERTFEYVPTIYKTVSEQIADYSKLQNANSNIESLKQRLKEMREQLSQIPYIELGEMPKCLYKSMNEIISNKESLEKAKTSLTLLQEQLNENPFEQQEKSIEEMKKHIVEIDESKLVSMSEDLENQNTLLKLLNSPSSFIRKTILDRSLAFLNQRIMEYLVKLGSLHKVSFNNDMSLTITKMGLDYDYVSTGEEGRITFALMFAFRDVWETLNNCQINFLAFDEIIDGSGLDINGVDMLIECIKSLKKNMLLVTHNDKLLNQLGNKIELVKEHDFTTIKGNM